MWWFDSIYVFKLDPSHLTISSLRLEGNDLAKGSFSVGGDGSLICNINKGSGDLTIDIFGF